MFFVTTKTAEDKKGFLPMIVFNGQNWVFPQTYATEAAAYSHAAHKAREINTSVRINLDNSGWKA